MLELTSSDPTVLRTWQAALDLAKTCNPEVAHIHHVTWLAARLFDELRPLHGLGLRERFNLQLAGILHDIGWIEGGKGHHKTSLRIILTTPLLPLDNSERLLIGSVARYHEQTLPSLKHDHYVALDPQQRILVHILGGMLRLADALDYNHRRRVLNVTCEYDEGTIFVHCAVSGNVNNEKKEARKRCDLLAAAFERKIVLRFKEKKSTPGEIS